MTGESTENLLSYIAELENKLIEAEETIEAIKYDKIDALVISTSGGEQIYTLSSAERPYRIFLEQMNEGAVTLSDSGIILFCNKRFADMIQVPHEQVLGSQIESWAAKTDVENLKFFLEREDDNLTEEIKFVCSSGSFISLHLSLKKLLIEDSEPVLCVVATDLTEKKKSEELVAAERLARTILEQAAEAIVVCDEKLRIIRASKTAEILAGESIIQRHFDSVFPLFNNKKNPLPLKKILDKFHSNPIEVTLFKKYQPKYNLMMNIGILSGVGNDTIGYVIDLTNITGHIEAEKKLSQSLKEKTILLKEIHHRVKNNLQIISSLLRLQSLYVPEDHLLGILNECQNRINSMALIHQKLYESKSFVKININDYLKELVVFLCKTYVIGADNVKIEVPEESISFSIDSAIPVGLILNELVSNSFKHAFPDKEKGMVNIKISLSDDNKVRISIKDNGIGFPDPDKFYEPTTLGLQLVHSLIEQIDGTVKLQQDNGTEIVITMPKDIN